MPIRRDREDPTTSTKRLVDQNPLLSMMPDVPPKLPVAYGPYGRDTQSLTRVDFPVSTLYMFLGRLERSLCWHKSQVVFLSGLFSRLGLARGCASAICNVPSHKWAGLLAGLYVAWPSTAPVLNDIAVPHGQRDVLKTESKFVSGAMCCHKDPCLQPVNFRTLQYGLGAQEILAVLLGIGMDMGRLRCIRDSSALSRWR